MLRIQERIKIRAGWVYIVSDCLLE